MITKRWLILTAILTFTTALLTTLHVSAQSRAIDLEVFVAEPSAANQIELYFETGSEDEVQRFFFVRGATDNAVIFNDPSPADAITVTYQSTEVRFIEAVGNAASGAIYQAFDNDVVDGQQYCYLLGQTLQNGSSEYYLEDIRCITAGDFATTSLDVTASTETGAQGETVAHTLEITNEGNRDQQFLISALNEDWTTQIPERIVFIPAGATITSRINVTIPSSAASGASDTATIRIERQDIENQPPDLPPYTIDTTITTRVEGDAEFFIYLPIIISDR